MDTSGIVATGPVEAAVRFKSRSCTKNEETWALRARDISSRRFGLVCYELWEYIGEGAMDAAERDDVALLDPSIFGGASDPSSDDDNAGGAGLVNVTPSPEPQQQQPVDWPEGAKLVTRVTAVLRVAAPGPAEDFGGVEWVHRHETKQVVSESARLDSKAAVAARAERLQRQQED